MEKKGTRALRFLWGGAVLSDGQSARQTLKRQAPSWSLPLFCDNVPPSPRHRCAGKVFFTSDGRALLVPADNHTSGRRPSLSRARCTEEVAPNS